MSAPAGLLAPADYPAVRAALDPRLKRRDLPDEVIALDIYRGAAERYVMGRDPDWATRPEAARRALVNAAVLVAAALLAPVVPQMISRTMRSFSERFAEADWEQRSVALRARAEAEIAAALGLGAARRRGPTLFAAAPGHRGR